MTVARDGGGKESDSVARGQTVQGAENGKANTGIDLKKPDFLQYQILNYLAK